MRKHAVDSLLKALDMITNQDRRVVNHNLQHPFDLRAAFSDADGVSEAMTVLINRCAVMKTGTTLS